MANANFIVQNGISIGGSTGATITADPTTGAVAIAPAATTAVPNPTATVFTTSGTVTTVATTGGVANVADLGTAANSSTTSTTFANLTITGNLISNSTGYIKVPAGTNAQRPQGPYNGMMRYNSDITSFEGYYAGAWSSLGGVKSVDGKAYIIAETSAGAGDDVVRVYAGDSGTSTQVMWASTSNVKVIPTTTATSSTSGALQVAGGAGIAGNLYVGTNAVISGNLTVQGNTVSISSSTLSIQDPIINLGTPADLTPLSAPTTSDIGLKLHYYDSADSAAFLGRSNADGTLVWYSRGSDTGNVFTGTVLGNVKIGSMLVANATASTSTTTGAVQIAGGAGIAGNVFTGGWIVPTGNVSQNLGTTTNYWNNIYGITFVGTSTTAKYADLAENYQADKPYMPGTVLQFGGINEVTVAETDTTRVAGIVSTNPAHLMNGALSGANVVALALTGRVPCMIIGPVAKGDIMVSAGHGYAKTNNNPAPGQAIGKAIESFASPAKGVIEVVVGRI